MSASISVMPTVETVRNAYEPAVLYHESVCFLRVARVRAPVRRQGQQSVCCAARVSLPPSALVEACMPPLRIANGTFLVDKEDDASAPVTGKPTA